MYPVLLAAVVLSLSALLSALAAQWRDVDTRYQDRVRHAQMITLAEGLERYASEFGNLPVTLATLTATPGYEHLRAQLDTWQHYAVSGDLTDGVWTFQRAALLSFSRTAGLTPAAYLAANACGGGDFASATAWCGRRDSLWFRRESRDDYPRLILAQRLKLHRTLQKFADHFSAAQAFPAKDASNNPLLGNSATAFPVLAGYAGTARNCSGNFIYQGIPLDCDELYDLWGNPVGYQFLATKHIALVAETPMFNAAGTRIVLAADFNVL